MTVCHVIVTWSPLFVHSQSVPGSMKLDEFDPVEVYVAIADFEATEEANISLTAGQHVQVGGAVMWQPCVSATCVHVMLHCWFAANLFLSREAFPPNLIVLELSCYTIRHLFHCDHHMTITWSHMTITWSHMTITWSHMISHDHHMISHDLTWSHMISLDCHITITWPSCDHLPQVLDSSRSDWWLVTPTDSELEGWVSVAKGWVPANYLERRVIEGAPPSPPPSPFIDETGELGRLVMK